MLFRSGARFFVPSHFSRLPTQDYPHRLALCSLGPGHGGTIQDGTRWLDSPTCRSGKFTKWVEVKPIKKLNGPTAVTFIADITTRYGIPHSIITDNGTNFAKGALARFCATQGIRLDLASVAHPQSNGQVERANGLILSGIKPRLVEPLERSAGCWLDELPAVLWSLRTTPNKSTGFTPFFLVYGVEAVIPTDIEFDSPRVTMYTEEEAEEARQDGVDLLEEG